MSEHDKPQEQERRKPRVDDIIGILGEDWTGELSSVEYVRRQREGRE